MSRVDSSSSTSVEPDEQVVADRRLDDVAPLDEHDPVGLGQLGEREVGDLGWVVEPVEIGVVERDRGPPVS